MPHFRTSDGFALYYALEGSGPPLVLLNGIMMNTQSWAQLVPAFAQHFTVLRYDFLGQGRSDKPRHGYSFAVHLSHLQELLAHLQLQSVHGVGVSYGAEVGLYAAAKAPDCLTSLVAGTAAAYVDPLLGAMVRAWRSAAEHRDPELLLDVFAPTVYGRSFLTAHAEFLPQYRKLFPSLVDDAWFDGLNGLLDDFSTLDLRPLLPQISCPILVLCGDEDLLKPCWHSEEIKRQIPNSRLQKISAAGHALFLEQPQLFAEAAVQWILRTEAGEVR